MASGKSKKKEKKKSFEPIESLFLHVIKCMVQTYAIPANVEWIDALFNILYQTFIGHKIGKGVAVNTMLRKCGIEGNEIYISAIGRLARK